MAWYNEKSVQLKMKEALQKKGFKITGESLNSGHGVDLKAYHPKRCYYWFIEVKGYPTGNSEMAQRQNYLWQVLGQIVGRMTQKNAYYGICLPDYKGFYRKKIKDNSLRNARRWLGLYFFLVTKKGKILKLASNKTEFELF